MWYVNTADIEVEDLGTSEFYINYVVCKWRFIGFGLQRKKCFILTMWYVNKPEQVINPKQESEFYINYVVCKFCWYAKV